MTPISLRSVVLPLLACFAIVLALLLTVQRAAGDDGGVPVAVALDAGLALDAAPAAPAPADPIASPGDALDGLRLWWRTGWVWGITFIVASVLIALSARVTYLRTGWRVVVVGTLSAMATVALGGKAAGLSDAQVVAAALYVASMGTMWLLRKNAATVDLSTATPEQIAAALAAANKPPAFPGPS